MTFKWKNFCYTPNHNPHNGERATENQTTHYQIVTNILKIHLLSHLSKTLIKYSWSTKNRCLPAPISSRTVLSFQSRQHIAGGIMYCAQQCTRRPLRLSTTLLPFRSVPTATSIVLAKQACISPVACRIFFSCTASTGISRDGWRSPRSISSIWVMLSTRRLKKLFSITATLYWYREAFFAMS